MAANSAEVMRIRKQLEATNQQLQEVLAENEQYKNYIESLLEYNNKLVTIIEKQLKVGSKVQSNLQPISQRTENDSEMISDNRSLSMRAMKVNNNTNQAPRDDQQQQQRQRRRSAKLEQIQEQPSPKSQAETYEAQIYREIYELIERYHQTYIKKRDDYSNAFKQIIYSLEDDKNRFNEMQENNMQILQTKSQQISILLRDIKQMNANSFIERIAEKNKRVAMEVVAMLERNKRN